MSVVKVSPWRTALSAGLVIASLNLLVLGVGHLLGADMLVAQSAGSAASEIGIGSVVLMSLAPTVLGGVALWLAARRSVRGWLAVGWLGLALGLVTVPMPFTVVASTGTSVTLGSMHVVAGLVWLTAVRRAVARRRDRAVPQVFEPA
jgi:hypothetical protein